MVDTRTRTHDMRGRQRTMETHCMNGARTHARTHADGRPSTTLLCSLYSTALVPLHRPIRHGVKQVRQRRSAAVRAHQRRPLAGRPAVSPPDWPAYSA